MKRGKNIKCIPLIVVNYYHQQNKNWKDLLTDEPFARKDIIVIQDPQNLDKFNISKFLHLKKDWKVKDDEKIHAKYFLKNSNAETEDILAELSKTYKGSITDLYLLASV